MQNRTQIQGERWRAPAGRDLTAKQREERRRHRQEYGGAPPETPKAPKKNKDKKCVVI
jgi:hypothetical protein